MNAFDPAASVFRQVRRVTCRGGLFARVAGLLLGLLLLAPRPAGAQSSCVDYKTYVHTVGGTKLPATTGGSAGGAPGIVVLDHPFASGARLAFVTNSDGASNHRLSCVDVTTPAQLADPAADADQLADIALGEPGTDIVVDPAFPTRPYLYISARDLDLIVVQVTDPAPQDPLNRDVMLTVLATRNGQSGVNNGLADANSLAVQARTDSTLIFVYETGAGSAFFPGNIRTYLATDAANPQLLATTNGSAGSGGEIVLNGTAAYIGHHFGINMFNIRNAAAPTYMGGLFFGGVNALALSADKTRLFVTGAAELQSDPSVKPFRVLDVTDPLAPALLGAVGKAEGFDQACGDIVIAGSHAFMDGPDGLQVADISNPSAPTVVGRASGMGVMGHIREGGVAIQGDYAFVTGSSRGLRAMQLGSRTSPATYARLNFRAYAMARRDSSVVVICDDGFRVLDVTTPSTPTVRAFVPLAPGGTAVSCVDLGDLAFLLRDFQLEAWSLTNPAAPVLLGTIGVNFSNWPGVALATRTVGANTYAYICGRAQMQVINVTNPAAMVLVGGAYFSRDLLDICVRDDRLYAMGQSRLFVLSLANPVAPAEVGSLDFPGESLAEVSADSLHVYAVGRSLHVIDTSVASTPTPITALPLDEVTDQAGICLDGSVAYVMNGSGGLACVDLGDLSSLLTPPRIGSLNPVGEFIDYQVLGADVLVVDGVLYGADGANGLWTAPTHCASAERSLCCATPSHGGNAGQAQLIISGFQLEHTDAVSLTRAGETPIAGTLLSVTTDQLVVQFDLTGRAPGLWSASVHDPAEGDLLLQDGFTVDAGGAPELDVTILGPTQLRGGFPSTYDVVVSNTGNIDGMSTILLVHGIPLAATVEILSDWEGEAGQVVSRGLPQLPGGRIAGGPGTPISSPIRTLETQQAIFIQAPRVPASGSVTFRFSLSPPAGGVAPFDLQATAVTPWDRFVIDIDPLLSGRTPEGASSHFIPGTGNLNAGGGGLYSSPCTPENTCLFEAAFGAVKGLPGPAASVLACYACVIYQWLSAAPQAATNACSDLVPCVQWMFGFQWGFEEFWNQMDQCTQTPPAELTQDFILDKVAEGLSTLQDCAGAANDKLQGIETLNSVDPNDKIGPSGVTAQHHLPNRGKLYYTVMFENQPSATLPAREVRITDSLPTASLDAATLRFHQVGFDTLSWSPLAPVASFVHDFDLRPGQNLLVRVQGSVDIPTGVVSVFYQGLDPATGLPPANPLVGWLPPNVAPPQGEGRVIFSVSPQASAGDGTTVCNEASIVFDANPPIQTPAWCNVFDLLPPSSDVAPLDTLQLNPDFPVTWAGSDATSGLQVYDIFVSIDGAPRTYWTRTTQTQKIFPGTPGAQYAFYSSARDSAGNSEPLEATPDATTRVTGISNVHEPPAPEALTFLARPARNPARAPISVTFGVGTADVQGGHAETRLGIFDVSGRLVRSLAGGPYEAGPHSLNWDGRDQQGRRASAGLYFVQLQVGGRQFRQRIVLLR